MCAQMSSTRGRSTTPQSTALKRCLSSQLSFRSRQRALPKIRVMMKTILQRRSVTQSSSANRRQVVISLVRQRALITFMRPSCKASGRKMCSRRCLWAKQRFPAICSACSVSILTALASSTRLSSIIALLHRSSTEACKNSPQLERCRLSNSTPLRKAATVFLQSLRIVSLASTPSTSCRRPSAPSSRAMLSAKKTLLKRKGRARTYECTSRTRRRRARTTSMCRATKR
mmetsp:Transcript_10903/g.14695  ORF Transcript_10903/g.14695 Transcript_10903/m.14695 type:complete len:229 (-) Transcript_10903:590-1276(-)